MNYPCRNCRVISNLGQKGLRACLNLTFRRQAAQFYPVGRYFFAVLPIYGCKKCLRQNKTESPCHPNVKFKHALKHLAGFGTKRHGRALERAGLPLICNQTKQIVHQLFVVGLRVEAGCRQNHKVHCFVFGQANDLP